MVQIFLGAFQGEVLEGYEGLFDEEVLSNLLERLAIASEGVLSAGRHRVIALPFGKEGQTVDLAVKAFGNQWRWKDRYDFKRGTKAARSYLAAAFLLRHGVGTPTPVAYFDRWEEGRLVESYYFSVYVEILKSFKEQLTQIYREDPDCAKLVSLLGHIGGSIRKMHDAGFCHRDLGNQNIELGIPEEEEWGQVLFIDLNRGRIRESLTMADRARDFSRIMLPSAFLEVLVKIYWQGPPPEEFVRLLKKFRKAFAWRGRTRELRHPFRKKVGGGKKPYPSPPDLWIWDSQSAQSAITMNRRERKRYYPKGRHMKVALSTLKAVPGVWREYRRLMPQAFSERVEMSGRFGMALEGASLDFGKQREFLTELGKIPVLLRFCHHEGRDQWTATARDVEVLRGDGHEVMIAMVQDRNAVLAPDSWREFLNFVLERVGHLVREVELCHAVNRMKWGVHSAQEQRLLLEPVRELLERYPSVKFTGPSCIDFEYHYVLAALEETPTGLTYSALSHHLYVDRREAPENFQGRFSTVEKCALLRAIAKWSPRCRDRVVVSEVNWPVSGSGIWSPVGATYQMPGQKESPLNVSDENYGHFMLRYVALALCSGFVDQIYWWRLVAHGFGLVDERAEGGWKARAGYDMLRYFLETVGSATFVEKLAMEEGVYALRFEREQDQVVMLWCHEREYSGSWPFEPKEVFDVFGAKTRLGVVGGAPVYCIL